MSLMRKFLPEIILLAGTAVSVADSAYPPIQAVRLVDIALERNPALASARANAEMAHFTGYHHRAWPAPQVSMEFYEAPVKDFPNPLTKEQHEIDYSISQEIPFPGKTGSMAEPEHRKAEAEVKRAEAAALDLRRRVLINYAELYESQWKIRLVREDRAETDRLLAVARAGYEGGMGSQADLLRADLEAARLDAEALDLRRMETEILAMLSALVGKPDERVVENVDSVIPVQWAMNRDTLKNRAWERRPDLDAMRHEVSMADAEITAARKEWLPDFMVRGTFKDMNNLHRTGNDWSLMVGMEVPIAPWSLGSIRSATNRAKVFRHKAERDYVNMRLMIGAEVESAVAAVESGWERLELARHRRIPLSSQNLRATLAAYQGGKLDFGEVIMALRESRMARESYHMAIADHLKAWAALEWAVGGEL